MTMPRGGARNRSGPGHDPNSIRTAERGITLTALPSEGYDGETPDFPLPKRVIWNVWFEGSGRNRERHGERDDGATESTWDRELTLWESLWGTPQACAWARDQWRWHTIAMYVRTFVICESEAATAADKGALHRFADQIGLTPAGLKENGWAIAQDQTAAKREERGSGKPAETSSARDRMKVVQGGDGA